MSGGVYTLYLVLMFVLVGTVRMMGKYWFIIIIQ